MRLTLRLLAATAWLALGLAACSGGSDSPAPPDPESLADPGRTTTEWFSGTVVPPTAVAGNWRAGGPDPSNAHFALVRESAHFAFYSDQAVAEADLDAAVSTLEEVVWPNLFGDNLAMPQPYADRADKLKTAVHIHDGWGLTGGAWVDDAGQLHLGMWIGSESLRDRWGLTHEFVHGWQGWATHRGGLDCPERDTCGWIHESHANFVPHQLPEFASELHCSELRANMPHLVQGSTRDRYCNWQFMAWLKDRHGPDAVNRIWTTPGSDPWQTLRQSMGWSVSAMNDFVGEWALHNVVWDYRRSGAAMRAAYGPITATDRAERLRRLMPLVPLDDGWASHRRFASPQFGAPQRFGYNVVRLYPDAGATTVRVRLRGVDVPGAHADLRWALVATDPALTRARYGTLQRGLRGEALFAVRPGEPLFLVVAATPTVHEPVVWDQDYRTLWRYPYLVEFERAWPAGFRDGRRDDCPAGTRRHAHGGGCAPADTPDSVFVAPQALVMPGARVRGNARIEDQAIVAQADVSGGVVGGLSVVGLLPDAGGTRFTVADRAQVRTAFYPLGFFEPGQGVAGSAELYGDVEYRGEGLTLRQGRRSGFVDATSADGLARDINPPGPWSWTP